MGEMSHGRSAMLGVVLISVILSYFDLQLNIFGVTIDQIGAAFMLIFIAHAGWKVLSDGRRSVRSLLKVYKFPALFIKYLPIQNNNIHGV